jgi:hypothetical protein
MFFHLDLLEEEIIDIASYWYKLPIGYIQNQEFHRFLIKILEFYLLIVPSMMMMSGPY